MLQRHSIFFPFVISVTDGAPAVVRPFNLSGFCSIFSTTLITCTQISCPVAVEERLAMSKYSSTTSKPTATDLMYMTSRAVPLMSVLSSKARLKAAHDFNISLKVSLILYLQSSVNYPKRAMQNYLNDHFFT